MFEGGGVFLTGSNQFTERKCAGCLHNDSGLKPDIKLDIKHCRVILTWRTNYVAVNYAIKIRQQQTDLFGLRNHLCRNHGNGCHSALVVLGNPDCVRGHLQKHQDLILLPKHAVDILKDGYT